MATRQFDQENHRPNLRAGTMPVRKDGGNNVQQQATTKTTGLAVSSTANVKRLLPAPAKAKV